MKSWGEYLQAQWRENLGVETTWEVVGAVTWVIQGREPAAHIFQSGWTPDYPDPDACLRANPVRRFTRWQNDTYDRLVEEARRVLDQGERVKLYRQADKILIEGAAIMPIIYSWSHMLIKPWVTKFPASPSDMWFWKDVVIEPH
jgi:oligopeptide transport system substrate-binding protein